MSADDGARRVLLLREGDTPYEGLDGVPGMELARVLTTAASTGLGGGFSRFTGEAVLAGWTLRYDEVFYVIEGELSIESGGQTVRGGPGEVILIPAGATVTYRSGPGTKAFFVLHPRDWADRTPNGDQSQQAS
jgi:ethanolamine utilization protein EutQ (cupin superfamily)